MPPARAARLRMLSGILTVIGTAGCRQVVELPYTPGARLEGTPTLMPLLPCLPKTDIRLEQLDPGCTTGFQILAGPRETTDGFRTECRYLVTYRPVPGCTAGRPLLDGRGAARVASIARDVPCLRVEGSGYDGCMSASLLITHPRTRLLSGILAAMALTSLGACRESHERHASYSPGAQRQQAFKEGNTWPPLPCLPRTDPRLVDLDHDCGAEDYEVVAGPNPVADGPDATRCHYRITYTTEPGVSCTPGRPLSRGAGAPRTAALRIVADWSAS